MYTVYETDRQEVPNSKRLEPLNNQALSFPTQADHKTAYNNVHGAGYFALSRNRSHNLTISRARSTNWRLAARNRSSPSATDQNRPVELSWKFVTRVMCDAGRLKRSKAAKMMSIFSCLTMSKFRPSMRHLSWIWSRKVTITMGSYPTWILAKTEEESEWTIIEQSEKHSSIAKL